MKNSDNLKTDWNQYYTKTLSLSPITRKFTEKKITSHLTSYSKVKNPILFELGGANSSFLNAIQELVKPSEYHVIDFNQFGLKILEDRKIPNLRTHLLDLVQTFHQNDFQSSADLVLSVGLIEHFDVSETALVIDRHFEIAKKGAIVLITFPTPTFLYRGSRFLLESFGLWDFPDERPLQFSEVRRTIEKQAEVLHEEIIWPICLTQGLIVARKK